MAISANLDPVSEPVSESVSDDPRYRAAFAAKKSLLHCHHIHLHLSQFIFHGFLQKFE